MENVSVVAVELGHEVFFLVLYVANDALFIRVVEIGGEASISDLLNTSQDLD